MEETHSLPESEMMSISQSVALGHITTWPQIVIRASLLGYDADSNLLKFMIRRMNESGGGPGVYRLSGLLREVVYEGSDIDELFEDSSLVETVLTMHGIGMWDENLSPAGTFDSIGLLMRIDMRNPRYMLKYLLHGRKHWYTNFDVTYEIITLVMERTERRREAFVRIGDGKMADKFSDFRRRLEEMRNEMFGIARNLN